MSNSENLCGWPSTVVASYVQALYPLAFYSLVHDSQEATYNPYYTLILSHLCANSYDHRFTFQYALWDFMRELESGSKVSKQRVGNVARAVAYVVARGGLSLTVFKVSSFPYHCYSAALTRKPGG